MDRHSVVHEISLVLLWLAIWEVYSVMVIYYKFSLTHRFYLAICLGIFSYLLYRSLWEFNSSHRRATVMPNKIYSPYQTTRFPPSI